MGAYFILVSLGMVPPPSEKNPHDPLWLVFCAGLAFLLGGIAVVTRAFAGGAAQERELPATAPRWIHVAQHLIALAITACLAAIGTWIAVGPGLRSFGISAPFLDIRGGGATFGRVMFGIGALITWLFFIALAIRGARQLFDRRKI
jgi:hypothetical protein